MIAATADHVVAGISMGMPLAGFHTAVQLRFLCQTLSCMDMPIRFQLPTAKARTDRPTGFLMRMLFILLQLANQFSIEAGFTMDMGFRFLLHTNLYFGLAFITMYMLLLSAEGFTGNTDTGEL